jgi:hypothetical protein
MTKIAPGDLDVAIVGQLPTAHLPLGNQFEPRSMDIVGFQAPAGVVLWSGSPWKARLGTRTMPSYSPTPIPNSTAAALELHPASGGNRKTCSTLLTRDVLLMFKRRELKGVFSKRSPGSKPGLFERGDPGYIATQRA